MRRLLTDLPVFVAALAMALGTLGACGRQATAGGGSALAAAADSEAVFGEVAGFELTERSGRSVSLESLRGRPCVVNFFFTTCSGPCPTTTAQMRKLQDDLTGTDVRLLSISVDPERDDLEALTGYADAFEADPERWWFATGAEEAIYATMRESFKLAVQRSDEAPLGEQVTHATRLIVLDGDARIRGYYDGMSDEGRRAAAARARFLDR